MGCQPTGPAPKPQPCSRKQQRPSVTPQLQGRDIRPNKVTIATISVSVSHSHIYLRMCIFTHLLSADRFLLIRLQGCQNPPLWSQCKYQLRYRVTHSNEESLLEHICVLFIIIPLPKFDF